jgi:HAD superfamily hydrolase (TIGR01509 family)
MDGVIVDSHPTHRCAWKQFLQSVGRETSEEELDFILDGRKREEILRYFLGDLSSEQLSNYGNRKDEMLRRLENGVHPVEGVLEFLAGLRSAGFKTAVATSAGTTRTRGTISDLGLKECFDVVVTGDDVLVGKPDPSIYRLAAERLGESPQNLLAIEDASSGVKAATGAGLRCIGIGTDSRAEPLRAAGAILVVPHFRSLSVEALSSLPS